MTQLNCQNESFNGESFMGNPSNMNEEFSRKLVSISLGRIFFGNLDFRKNPSKGKLPH